MLLYHFNGRYYHIFYGLRVFDGKTWTITDNPELIVEINKNIIKKIAQTDIETHNIYGFISVNHVIKGTQKALTNIYKILTDTIDFIKKSNYNFKDEISKFVFRIINNDIDTKKIQTGAKCTNDNAHKLFNILNKNIIKLIETNPDVKISDYLLNQIENFQSSTSKCNIIESMLRVLDYYDEEFKWFFNFFWNCLYFNQSKWIIT